MYLLGLGIVLIALKYLEIGQVATWEWWWVLSPFGLAVVWWAWADWWIVLTPFGLAVAWWAWADWSGYTKKKVVQRENQRRQARIDKSRQSLGIETRRR